MTVSGIQWGVKYTLTGSDGTIAVFNDSTDPNYVGILSPDSSGLDSPDIRESFDDIPEGDGAVHGTFFKGRRPVILSGVIRHTDATDRNTRIDRLRRAAGLNTLEDSILTWTPDGGESLMLRLRLNQALRVVGGWVKSFQIPLIAEDPLIYSESLNTTEITATTTVEFGREYPRVYPLDYGALPAVGQGNVTNEGDVTSPPILRVYGPGQNPAITNMATGETITLLYTLAAGDYLHIDPLKGEVLLNGVLNRYSAVDLSSTSWWGLEPGTNDIRLRYFSYSTGAKLQVDWRDAYL